MSAPDLITVVIPCHNAEPYLAAAIESVLRQRGAAFEIVVVDDGSSDGSARLVEERFPQVRLLRQANQGVAAARNRGIEQARGDWIAFLDADDLWADGKLQAQCRLLRSRPDCRLCYTAWHVWPSDGPAPSAGFLRAALDRGRDAARWAGPSGWIYRDLLRECAVWTSTVLVERSLVAAVGGFDTGLTIGEDWDLWLRASRETPILRIPEPFAFYRMHPASLTQRPPDRNYKHLVISRALSRWGYDSPDGSSADKEIVNRELALSWSDFAGAHLQAGNLAEARRGALMALRTDSASLPGWKLLARTWARSLRAVPHARA